MVLSVQYQAQEIICHNVYLSRQHVLRLLRNLVRRPFDKLLAVCSRQRDLKRTSGSMLPGCLLLWVCLFSFVVIGCYYHCHYDHYQHLYLCYDHRLHQCHHHHHPNHVFLLELVVRTYSKLNHKHNLAYLKHNRLKKNARVDIYDLPCPLLFSWTAFVSLALHLSPISLHPQSTSPLPLDPRLFTPLPFRVPLHPLFLPRHIFKLIKLSAFCSPIPLPSSHTTPRYPILLHS